MEKSRKLIKQFILKYTKNKKSVFLVCFFIFLIFSIGCENDDENLIKPKTFTYEFMIDSEAWVGDFADYPNDPNVEDFYKLEFSHSSLPNPLNADEGALRQSGRNHSDDLFMFVKRKITELEPNTKYNIDIEIEFATNAASGSVGVGGSPGESVFIKAGASTKEPLKILNDSDNHYRMNIDKGNQSQGGIHMDVIGDFANGTESNNYKLKVLHTLDHVNVMSNSRGELWLIVGTDSGFEATTTIYYNQITVNIK